MTSNKVLWLFGRPCSGKTTLANVLVNEIPETHFPCVSLDGDEIRKTVNKDLQFSPEDREENIRRIAEMSLLLMNQGFICVVSVITPLECHRTLIKNILKDDVVLIYVNCPLDICEERDVKGMYKKARNGELRGFTGIDAPFEEPKIFDICIETDKINIEECFRKIKNFI